MNPLFLILGGGALLYFLTKKNEPDYKQMPPQVSETAKQLMAIPGFQQLPDAVKSQVLIAAASGSQAQLVKFADDIEKLNPQFKPVAEALRRIAATRP